jgi:hypothetical protein
MRLEMDLQPGEIKEHRQRAEDSLSNLSLTDIPLETFKPTHSQGVCILRLLPLTDTKCELLFVMYTNGMSLYGLVNSGDHAIGWLFVLPKGNTITLNNGIVHTGSLFHLKRESLEKRARKIGKLKGIDPVVYMNHTDFCIMGLDQGDILVISRNNTNVVTQ